VTLGEVTLDASNRAERYRNLAAERRRIAAIGSSTKIRDIYVRLTARNEQDVLPLSGSFETVLRQRLAKIALLVEIPGKKFFCALGTFLALSDYRLRRAPLTNIVRQLSLGFSRIFENWSSRATSEWGHRSCLCAS